jgi:predicted RNase H-like HicB family nuclease
LYRSDIEIEKFVVVFLKGIEELPGADTQGKTLEEARENLKEAIKLVLETYRQLTKDEIAGKEIIPHSCCKPIDLLCMSAQLLMTKGPLRESSVYYLK